MQEPSGRVLQSGTHIARIAAMPEPDGTFEEQVFVRLSREPEIAERCKRGKARAIGTIAQTLISKARAGDTASMIFYLKTQAGWRETAGLHVSATPLSGEDQSPDAAFRFFVDHLDQIGARIGQQVEPVSTQRHMIVETQLEPALELQR